MSSTIKAIAIVITIIIGLIFMGFLSEIGRPASKSYGPLGVVAIFITFAVVRAIWKYKPNKSNEIAKSNSDADEFGLRKK